jgi:hypothetical protein
MDRQQVASDISYKRRDLMKQDLVSDIEKLYDQTFKYLEEEGMVDAPQAPGLTQTEYRNTIKTVPEKYLLKNNLLLLLKDV